MNRTWVVVFQGPFVYVVQRLLGLISRLTVPAVAVAIVVTTVDGPDNPEPENSAVNDLQRVRVEGEGNHYRIFAKIPSQHNMMHLQIVDPTGHEHLNLTYSDQGLLYTFSRGNDPFQFGYAKNQEGTSAVNLRTPTTDYRVELQPSGETGVTVVDPRGPRVNLGELWVEPSGAVRTHGQFTRPPASGSAP